MEITPEHLSKMGKKEIQSHQYSHMNYILWLLIESHIEYVKMYI